MLRFKNDMSVDQSIPFLISLPDERKSVPICELDRCELARIGDLNYVIKSGAHAGWFIKNLIDSWVERVPDDLVQATHLSGPIHYLDLAKTEMLDRAVTYDTPTGEKSMRATVEAFNAIMGRALDENGGRLTEAMGWEFMSILKKVRQFSRKQPHLDSATDDVAYTALAAEARMNEANA